MLRVILKHWAESPIVDTVRAVTGPLVPSVGPTVGGVAEMSSLYLRMRQPQLTAATMREKRMIDSMTCTELSAAEVGQPSWSTEALSLDDEAGAILPSLCHEGQSNRMYL